MTKVLDGTDVIMLLPTGAGKTAILVSFTFVLNRLKQNPGEFSVHIPQFPAYPIMTVVYPTNCLDEQQGGVHRCSGTCCMGH